MEAHVAYVFTVEDGELVRLLNANPQALETVRRRE